MSQSSFTNMKITNGVLIARPEREKIGEYESPIMKAEIEEQAPAAKWKIVMEMHDVRLVASAGLGALVSLNQGCKKNGGKLVLCGLDANLKAVFELTKLHRVLMLVDTTEAAVKAMP